MTKRLAIVSTIGGTPWGGSEELWSQAAVRLVRQDVKIRVSIDEAINREHPRLRELANGGSRLQVRRSSGRARRLARKFTGERKFKFLSTDPGEIVLISQAGHLDGLEWMRECRKRGIPYAIICQAAGEWFWPQDEDAAEARECFESAVGLYFAAKANLELARKQLVSPLAKGKIIRNPFDVAYNAPLAWPAGDGVLKLACVGRLTAAHKGQDLIFDALRLDKWKDRQIQVSVYGKGPNEKMFREYCKMHGLHQVTFAGYVDNVETIWASHHGLILPSRHEGLPIVIMQAMLCGRICITTDTAGNAELIDDNETGFIAAAPRVSLVDEAMERAWIRRDDLKAMGQEAARRARLQIPEDPVGEFTTELCQLMG